MFINALSIKIPQGERVITIEDAAELNLEQTENLVRMEARMPNMEGELEISIRDLIRASLRMRPTRIIVGEVRDRAALDMLQAMNTGHRGCISTGHANSAQDMMSRLETMALMGGEMPVEAIRQQIASALELIIHLERFRDGSRKVVSITEVLGYEETGKQILTAPLFLWQKGERGEGLYRCGRLSRRKKWEQRAKEAGWEEMDQSPVKGGGDSLAVLPESSVCNSAASPDSLPGETGV